MARNAAAEGFKKIVAAGGDGTINEVVNGLAGSEATLGLLPIGTVNVFAQELGLPTHSLDLCWDIIEADETRLVDLPSANGKYFVQLAGVGLDAQVVKETSLTLKRNFGPLSYLISAAQVAARQPPRLFIESENTLITEGSFVLVGNGRRYGGPFPFFKQALLDDGLLDVVAFKRLGYLEIIKYLQDVFFNSEINLPEVEVFSDPKTAGFRATRMCRWSWTANWWEPVRWSSSSGSGGSVCSRLNPWHKVVSGVFLILLEARRGPNHNRQFGAVVIA